MSGLPMSPQLSSSVQSGTAFSGWTKATPATGTTVNASSAQRSTPWLGSAGGGSGQVTSRSGLAGAGVSTTGITPAADNTTLILIGVGLAAVLLMLVVLLARGG